MYNNIILIQMCGIMMRDTPALDIVSILSANDFFF